MSLTDLETALVLFRRSSGTRSIGPRPESLIRTAEEKLGVTLPPNYRRFLGELGYAGIRGQEIYGLLNDDFENGSVPDGIWVTLNERKFPNTPHQMIVIGDTGYCSFYVLDTARRTPDGECPVVEWWPGSGDDPADCEVIADDFGAFFLMLVREALERDD